jgi:hypothetical protein
MPTRVKITGDKEFLAQIQRASKEILDACQKDAENAAKQALAASQAHVPVNTGQLKASGYVDPVHRHDTAVSCSCGYDHEWAAHIHEGFTYGIRGPAPKFLTKGANFVRRSFVNAVTETINGVLARLFGR